MDAQRFKGVTRHQVDSQELQRILTDTRMINSQVTGKEPEPIIVKKDARQDFEFIQKFKEFVSQNSKMESHFKALKKDPEIVAI